MTDLDREQNYDSPLMKMDGLLDRLKKSTAGEVRELVTEAQHQLSDFAGYHSRKLNEVMRG